MGLGKTILLGCAVTAAIAGGHGALACELSQAPKQASALAIATAIGRRPVKLILPERWHLDRRAPAYASAPSRRIILQ